MTCAAAGHVTGSEQVIWKLTSDLGEAMEGSTASEVAGSPFDVVFVAEAGCRRRRRTSQDLTSSDQCRWMSA
jgi:hypothetical protein